MLRLLDNFLNPITMYRLVHYGLLALTTIAVVLGFFGVLPYSAWSLLISVTLFGAACVGFHFVFAKLFGAPANIESSAITSLILFFVFAPPTTVAQAAILVLASFLAIASKYGFAFRDRHIFNPAAFAAFAIGVAGGGSAVWWVGSVSLLVPTMILGILVVRKLRRFEMVALFVAIVVIAETIGALMNGYPVGSTLMQLVSSWPTVFFASIMFTEPQTSPGARQLRWMYAALVGLLFSAKFSIGPIFSTPELALLVGNLFVFIVSNKHRWNLKLIEKRELAPNIFEFIFTKGEGMHFKSGQYVEWTLPHAHPDTRGIRRYFTIAASPTEDTIRLGVRFSPNGSSFKSALKSLVPGSSMFAVHASGDFTLPKNTGRKLVFIAGGIGVTPFRSMIQYLIDTKEQRDIVLLYACSTPSDFAYEDLFEKARQSLNLKFIPIVADPQKAGERWHGKTGYIDEAMLMAEVPDYKERSFYLSGPGAMVDAYKRVLRNAGIKPQHVVTDYFPGF